MELGIFQNPDFGSRLKHLNRRALQRKEIEIESTEQMIKELLEFFLCQDTVNRMDSKDKLIKVYRVNPNIVRVDIRMKEGEINHVT